MQHEIIAIASIDLDAVTGGRLKDPEPPGEVPAQRFPNRRLGDWLSSFGGARGEARSERGDE
jgi:hypothetical protein